ncbi:MAG: hypothetical protein K6G88_13830 [Lachnospiraceae bacterium]|nr:hypothetical protein [Lachnospiraceae bacterium]
MNSKKIFNLSIYSMLIFAICLATLIYAFSLGINGNDFWWHLKSGEWIVNNKSVPTTDIFSWYTAPLHTKWISHEWLSEVIFHLIMKGTGVVGIFLLALLTAVILYVLFVKAAGENMNNNYLISFTACIFFACLMYIYCYGRPQIFSFLLLSVELHILYTFHKNPDTKFIWIIPVLGLIWSNIHGGSSNVVYILPVIFLVSGVFDIRIGKIIFQKYTFSQIKKLIGVIILSVIALCINPHGIGMLLYPLSNMNDSLMLKMIVEWAAPDAKKVEQLFFFYFPVISVSLILILTKKDIDGIDFLIYGFFTYMFFRSTRFIVFFVIAAGFYMFKYVSKPKKQVTYDGTRSEKMVAGILFGLAVIMACFGLYNCTVTYHSKRGLIAKAMNDDFIKLVKEEKPERLLNDYNYGETLIYNDIPVFIDSRADVYTGEIFSDYSKLYMLKLNDGDNNDETVEEILSKYNFDAFLLSNSSPLVTYLYDHKDKYEMIKTSKTTSYFKVIK